jgi:DNA-directed DNA polymerase III PolC
MLIPLRVYSEYSLLKSSIKVTDAIKYCKDNKLEYMGMANENNMFGTFGWNLELQKNKIKPILGTSLKVSGGFVWAYCLNSSGYEELCELLSFSYIEKQGTLEIQDVVLKNCILLVDESLNFEEIRALSQNNNVNIAIARQRRSIDSESSLFQISNELKSPIVAAPKFFYPEKKSLINADCLWCIKNNTYIYDEDREKVNDDEYFKTQDEFAEIFADIPMALENSCIIARKCNFLLKYKKPIMPEMGVQDPGQTIKELAQIGLEKKNKHTNRDYRERLDYELSLINQMGFSEYFLIVADIIKWAKDNDIPVGPGRGSAASSLVAYCLGITDIDPIRFNLMFERFLNPGRVTMPDIDSDFCQESRERVIQYIQTRFGKENVAHIMTFGSLQYRAALRDVGRVLQMPHSLIDELCKRLPPPFQGVAPTLKELREKEISTAFMNEENKQLFEIAEDIEGMPRHSSVHAAGIVIGNRRLSKLVPLFKEPGLEMPIIQYAMKDAEAIGLVKFDILGLTILSVLKKTCEFLKRRDIHLDLSSLPLDDEASFKLLQGGWVKAIFQMDSPGFKNLMLEMKPNCFEDIIAAGALYRPGPMADIPMFVACKHGREQVSFLIPQMEEILKETYGVIVYQEQVLQIAKELAGYSLKDADLLRRAMGKKIKSEMKLHEEMFIKGIIEHSKASEAKARQLFENLAKFASYGFPKAHAAPYGLMTYQTAYCKSHYPVEFLCASLGYEIHLEKIEEIIQEAKKLGVCVLPPSINFSEYNFDVKDNKIVFGLANLKGIGEAARSIIEERKNRNFSSIADLISRVKLNKRVMENLVYSGAFDEFKDSRANQFDQITKEAESNNFSLFDFTNEIKEWTDEEILMHELDSMHTVFSNDFLKIESPIIQLTDSLSKISERGFVLAFAIKAVMKKNKDGKELFHYEFVDQDGIQKINMNYFNQIESQQVVIEIEKFSITRYNIKKIHKIDDFFGQFKKIFLKDIQIHEVLDAEAGGTSVYIFDADSKIEYVKDIKLTPKFLNKFKKNIVQIN